MGKIKIKRSEIGLDEALRKILVFNPIKIYYNRKLIWDDTLDIKNWISLDRSINIFKKLHYNKIIITDIKIKIVEFHHSIIYLKGACDK